MIARTAANAGLARGLNSSRLPALPRTSIQQQQRRVVVRFKESDNKPELQNEVQSNLQDVQQELEQLPISGQPTGSKLTPQQLQEVMNKNPFNISPYMANLRADMGKSAANDLSTLSTFDGPAPETINGRLAMLGVVAGLAGEWFTGMGLLQQTADHPVVVFASYVILAIATYTPLLKGYTRKEPFANTILDLNWSPKAENWNGRLAMLGFLGMILTEAASGVNTLQAWGLQPTNFTGFH